MVLEHVTSATPRDVLSAAKTFFARRNPLYAAFVEQEGPQHLTFRGQGGEELVIAVAAGPSGGTAVRASTYLFDQQAQRFFTSLPPGPPAPSQGAA